MHKVNREKISKAKRSTKYPGVTFRKDKNPESTTCWRSQIGNNGYRKYLGGFPDPISATIVYQLVADEIYQ